MKTNDSYSFLDRVFDLCISRVATSGVRRLRTRGENQLNGVRTRASPKLRIADPGNLMQREGRILGAKIDDLRAKGGGKCALVQFRDGGGWVGWDQARHTYCIEEVSP